MSRDFSLITLKGDIKDIFNINKCSHSFPHESQLFYLISLFYSVTRQSDDEFLKNSGEASGSASAHSGNLYSSCWSGHTGAAVRAVIVGVQRRPAVVRDMRRRTVTHTRALHYASVQVR